MKVILADSLRNDHGACGTHAQLQAILNNNHLVLGTWPKQLICEAYLMHSVLGEGLVVDFAMQSSFHNEPFCIGGCDKGKPLPVQLVLAESTWYMSGTLFMQVAKNANALVDELMPIT